MMTISMTFLLTKKEKKIAKVINTRTKDKQNTHAKVIDTRTYTYTKHTHTRDNNIQNIQIK